MPTTPGLETSSDAKSLSLKAVNAFGVFFGEAMWRTLPQRRHMAVQAIRHHLELPEKEAASLARESFRHTGRAFLELFAAKALDHRFVQARVSFSDADNFYRMVQIDRPIVAATGHLGAWELMSGISRLFFQGRRSQIIVKQPLNPLFRSALTSLRGIGSNEIVSKDNAAPTVLRCLLRDRGISAFLVDHNAKRSKAVFLPFLNELASVNAGPAVLAVRAKALVWPIFLLRRAPGKYLLHSLEPLDTTTLPGSMQERIEATASFYTQAVEATVRSCPEQWFWMHKRWRTRPLWEKNAAAPAPTDSHDRTEQPPP